MALAVPSLAGRRHIYSRLRAAAWFGGVGIRQGAPEPGKTGSDLSIYPYAAGPNEGPVGIEPIIATPTIAVTRSYAVGDTDAEALAVQHVQRLNEVLHGSSGATNYGYVVSCIYAREIDALEADGSGKKWQRLGSIFEVTVRSQG